MSSRLSRSWDHCHHCPDSCCHDQPWFNSCQTRFQHPRNREIWQTVLLDQPGHTCDTNRQAKMYHRHYMDLFADVWPDSLLSREGSHYSSKMDIKILIAGKLWNLSSRYWLLITFFFQMFERGKGESFLAPTSPPSEEAGRNSDMVVITLHWLFWLLLN